MGNRSCNSVGLRTNVLHYEKIVIYKRLDISSILNKDRYLKHLEVTPMLAITLGELHSVPYSAKFLIILFLINFRINLTHLICSLGSRAAVQLMCVLTFSKRQYRIMLKIRVQFFVHFWTPVKRSIESIIVDYFGYLCNAAYLRVLLEL